MAGFWFTVRYQEPVEKPYEYKYGTVTWLDWAISPIEVNAPKRLLSISSDLRAVAIRELTEGDEIWIVGDQRFVARSNDDGHTWSDVDVGIDNGQPKGKLAANFPAESQRLGDYPLRPANFYDIEFVGESGWIVGDGGTILKTTDGGRNWLRQHSTVPYVLNAVSFSDENNGLVVGAEETVLTTTDGGETWNSAKPSSNVKAPSVGGKDCFYTCASAAGGQVAYIAGMNGTIHFTPDGGKHGNPSKRDCHQSGRSSS